MKHAPMKQNPMNQDPINQKRIDQESKDAILAAVWRALSRRSGRGPQDNALGVSALYGPGASSPSRQDSRGSPSIHPSIQSSIEAPIQASTRPSDRPPDTIKARCLRRAASDGDAIARRWHDKDVHGRYRPQQQGWAFDWMEKARLEALSRRWFPGVAANLHRARLYAMAMPRDPVPDITPPGITPEGTIPPDRMPPETTSQGITPETTSPEKTSESKEFEGTPSFAKPHRAKSPRAKTSEDKTSEGKASKGKKLEDKEDFILSAFGAIAKSPCPKQSVWSDRFALYRDALRGALARQQDFAVVARALLDRFSDDVIDPGDPGDPGDMMEPVQSRGQQGDGDKGQTDGPPSGRSEQESPSQGRDRDSMSDAPSAKQDMSVVDSPPSTPSRGGHAMPFSMHPAAAAGGAASMPSYRPYTTRYDLCVPARSLARDDEIAKLYAGFLEKVRDHRDVVNGLSRRLHRILLTQSHHFWRFDQEDGVLDPARLERVIVDPCASLIWKKERRDPLRDTVVSLLIDNSGSMRGMPIAMAALCADILTRTLERCGVRVEILGFTTRAWKGGQSHRQWDRKGRKPHPGRLNDCLHIVYKSADTPYRKSRCHIALMLKEGLLKENIDGEALLWARRRLLQRPEKRRIIAVISDGAPVDDATLCANFSNILEQHLRFAIGVCERSPGVELIAFGIGHDVGRYYRRAVTINEIDTLGQVLLDRVGDVFRQSGKKKASADRYRAR